MHTGIIRLLIPNRHCLFAPNALTCSWILKVYTMLMTILNAVNHSAFYNAGTNAGFYLATFFILLFAAMFVYATIKYAKR